MVLNRVTCIEAVCTYIVLKYSKYDQLLYALQVIFEFRKTKITHNICVWHILNYLSIVVFWGAQIISVKCDVIQGYPPQTVTLYSTSIYVTKNTIMTCRYCKQLIGQGCLNTYIFFVLYTCSNSTARWHAC